MLNLMHTPFCLILQLYHKVRTIPVFLFCFDQRFIFSLLAALGVSHCGRFSCGAQALGTWASVVVAHGLSCRIECGIFPTAAAAAAAAAKSLQSCPTLCDPIDGSPPGFPVPGILQARSLEWVAISFSNA